MYLHFTKHTDGAVTYSNYPISENGIDSLPFEASEDDLQAVLEGTAAWDIQDGQLITIPSDRKANQDQALADATLALEARKARKLELIQKVTSGTATVQEQEEFANLL